MAKSSAGAWDLPARPTVGFLLKFVGVAVNLWQSKTKPKMSATSKPQQTAAKPVAKPVPAHEKASREEVMAALCRSPTVK